jgi:hypothetical protein
MSLGIVSLLAICGVIVLFLVGGLLVYLFVTQRDG